MSIARRFAPSYQGNRESRAATVQEIEWYISGLEDDLKSLKNDIIVSVGGGSGSTFHLIPENDPKNKFFTT